MSFFDRPDSPPPREPSPEPLYTPLPSPHLRARDRQRQRSSPLVPPGLAPPRFLLQSRSYDNLADAVPQTLKRRTRSNIEPASPPHNQGAFHRRRTHSVTTPHAPPASLCAVPPVPPLPGTVRSPALFEPHYKTAVTPIFLPDLHDMSPVSQCSFSTDPPTPPVSEKKSIKRLPSLFSVSSAAGTISSSSLKDSSSSPPLAEKEKPKNTVAMTCLKFFSMHRRSSKRSLRSSATQ